MNYLLEAYEVRGMLTQATSYNNAAVGSGTVVNDVLLTYNGFGKLSADYQAHSGAVNGTTLASFAYLGLDTRVRIEVACQATG